jgi:hypothetical protein
MHSHFSIHIIVQIILFTSLEVREYDKVKTEAFLRRSVRPAAPLPKKKPSFHQTGGSFGRKTEKVRDRRKTA